MMEKPLTDIVTINLRLPRALHTELTQVAQKHNRSLQKQLLYAIESGLTIEEDINKALALALPMITSSLRDVFQERLETRVSKPGVTPQEFSLSAPDVEKALQEAQTAEEIYDLYHRLAAFYRQSKTIRTHELGTPQTPEDAAFAKLDEIYSSSLSEEQKAVVEPTLVQIGRTRSAAILARQVIRDRAEDLAYLADR